MLSHTIKLQRNKSRKLIKYKLLLDEGLSLAKSYPKLNNIYNLKHIVHDLNQSRIKDKPLYDLATKEGRILIVFNVKDFRHLIKRGCASVIALSENLSNKEADLKITKVLKDIKSNQTKGHLISISKSGTKFIPFDN